jgi:hypothetical protein
MDEAALPIRAVGAHVATHDVVTSTHEEEVVSFFILLGQTADLLPSPGNIIAIQH